MADMNNDVLNMVIAEMRSTPKPDAHALLKRAQQMDTSLKGMSVFAFSGKYMMTARRMLKSGAAGAGKKAAPKKAKAPVAKKTGTKTAAKKTGMKPAAKAAPNAPAAAKKTTRKVAKSAPRRAAKVAANAGNAGAALNSEARRRVRDILVTFGKEISGARDDTQKLIDIMAGVETRIDRIAEVIGR